MINLFDKVLTTKDKDKTDAEINDLKKSELVSTEKTLIENNRMLLPSQPDGALIFNLALVYDEDGVEIYDDVKVEKIDGNFFAKFNSDITDVNGRHGVVSYMSQVHA